MFIEVAADCEKNWEVSPPAWNGSPTRKRPASPPNIIAKIAIGGKNFPFFTHLYLYCRRRGTLEVEK